MARKITINENDDGSVSVTDSPRSGSSSSSSSNNTDDPVEETIHGGCGLPVLILLIIVSIQIFMIVMTI